MVLKWLNGEEEPHKLVHVHTPHTHSHTDMQEQTHTHTQTHTRTHIHAHTQTHTLARPTCAHVRAIKTNSILPDRSKPTLLALSQGAVRARAYCRGDSIARECSPGNYTLARERARVLFCG